jgi:hypothetical protein
MLNFQACQKDMLGFTVGLSSGLGLPNHWENLEQLFVSLSMCLLPSIKNLCTL